MSRARAGSALMARRASLVPATWWSSPPASGTRCGSRVRVTWCCSSPVRPRTRWRRLSSPSEAESHTDVCERAHVPPSPDGSECRWPDRLTALTAWQSWITQDACERSNPRLDWVPYHRRCTAQSTSPDRLVCDAFHDEGSTSDTGDTLRPTHFLHGSRFFLTVSLLTIGFHLGWTDGDSVTLLGRPSFCRTCF